MFSRSLVLKCVLCTAIFLMVLCAVGLFLRNKSGTDSPAVALPADAPSVPEKAVDAPARVADSSGSEPRKAESHQPVAATPPAGSGQAQTRPVASDPVITPASPVSELDQFDAWTARYLADPDNRGALEASGIALAKARQPVMRQLIVDDPAQALQRAVTPRVRAVLPTSILTEIEREISGEGFYGVLAVCGEGTDPAATGDHAGHAHRVEREVRLGEELFRAHVPTSALDHPTEENASIYGVAIGGDLALSAEEVVRISPADAPQVDPATPGVAGIHKGRWYWFENAKELEDFEKSLDPQPYPTAAAGPILDPAAPPPQPSPPTVAYNQYSGPYSWARGPKTVMVFLVRASDAPAWPDPPTFATLDSQLNDSSTQYFQASYGKTWFGPKYINPGLANEMLIPRLVVTQVLNLPRTAAEYTASFGLLNSDCVNAARALGGSFAAGQVNDPSNFDRQVVMSNVKMIGSTGLAYVGGRFAWLGNGLAGGVALHEWGHNWGVVHANYWVGANKIPRSQTGTGSEYGDGADIMGGGTTMFNAMFKKDLGFLDAVRGDVLDVTAEGTHRLYDHVDPYGDNETSRLRALVLPGMNFSSNRIVLGFRHEGGVDGGPSRNDWDRTAVQMHAGIAVSGMGGSHYIDTTPGSNASDDRIDGAIKIGRTYSEGPNVYGTHLYGGVHVTPILRGSTPALGQPHEWIDVVVKYGAPSANAPVGTMSVSNTTPAVGVPVTLTVTALDTDGDTLAYDWSYGDGKQSHNNSNVQTKSWSAPGFYLVNCTVSDMTGRTSVVSAWVNVGNLAYRAPENSAVTSPGLAYRYYEGSFATMPDFTRLSPVQSGSVTTFSIADRLVSDGFAFLFEGYITVPTTDIYTFHLDSDDGARLYIGNTLVVDGNALRSSSEESTGNIALSAGRHAIRVEYFHQSGSENLGVSWSTLTTAKSPVTASMLGQTVWGSNVPPVVAVSAPLPGSIYPSGSGVTLSATATDADGIAVVRYFEGQNFIGESSTGPNFSFTWQNLSSGVHSVRAIAYDTTGRWSPSATISFEMRAPEATNIISVNFASNAGESITVGDKAGAVHFVKGWNNLTDSNSTLANLKDQTESATTASIGVNFSQSFTGIGGTGDGNGRLLHSGYWERNSGTGRVTVSGIPYPEYDVYVYLDAPRNVFEGSGFVEDNRLGTYTLNGGARYARNSLSPHARMVTNPPNPPTLQVDSVGDYPSYETWTGMKEATAASAGAPAAETLGNYTVFRGLSDPSLNLVVQNNQAINGIQIVQVAPATPRLVLRPSGGSTVVVEGGAGDSYTAELSVAPTSNVTVTISPDSQVTTSAGTLVFTPLNWSIPQTINVAAVDDELNEGSPHSATITHTVSSSGNYASIPARQFAVSVTDSDRPTVSVYAVGNATEGGAVGRFRFVRGATLAAGGSQTVNFLLSGGLGLSLTSDISLAGGNVTLNTVSGAGTVTFPANATSVDVTVTATDDAVVESSETLTATLSAGSGYLSGSATVAVMKMFDNDYINRWTQYFAISSNEPTSFEQTFDCNNKKITFTPDGSAAFYSAAMVTVNAFSSSTAGHTQLVSSGTTLFSAPPYQAAHPVTFFGATYPNLWISVNGSICLEDPLTKTSQSLSNHFTVKRIAALWSTGFKAVGGTTTIHAGRVTSVAGQERTVVTYNKLIYGTSTQCSFQVEFFDNGVITMTWLNTPNPSAVLVGLSNGGGVPSPFAQTNLSDISFGATNAAPLFASLPPTTATQGQPWSYTIRTTDPNGTALVIGASTKPAWLTLLDLGDGTATLAGTPPVTGTFPVVLEVSDGSLSTSQSFSLTVVPAGGNTLPVFTTSPPLAGSAGAAFSYSIAATDPDGHSLTFTRANLPGWLTLTPTGAGTATLTGTIPAGLPTSYDLAVAVEDGVGITTQSWRMIVNGRPVIQINRPTAIRPWLASTDLKLVLDARVTDDGLPGNSVVTAWSTVSGPGSAVFDNPTQPSTLVRFPTNGAYVIRLSADDGAGPTIKDIPVSVGVSPVAPPGVKGEYFAGTALSGLPAVTQIDPTIDFGFGSSISVRWTGWILPQYSESYSIIPNVDDGARVWVNGVKVVDDWNGGPPRDLAATPIALQANVPAKVVMEFYNGGNGSAKLQWQSASRSKQVIPAAFWRSEDPNYNKAPILDGLPDRDGVAGAAVELIPAASDDGLPVVPGLVGYGWSQLSGPLSGAFSDVTSANTTFTSVSPGSYLLRLEANDGEITVAREFTLNLVSAALSFSGWMANYPSLSGADAGETNDPDGDGMSNFLEFALNTDPTTPSLGCHPIFSLVDGIGAEAGSKYPTLTYRQRKGGTGVTGINYTVGDVVYAVEVSGTLSSPWKAGADWVEATGTPLDNGDGTETVSVRRKIPLGAADAKCFMRLKVSNSE